MSKVIYFHELTESEQHAVGDVMTWQQVAQKHPQPPWCSYHEALNPGLGCWSLTGHGIHTENDCAACPLYLASRAFGKTLGELAQAIVALSRTDKEAPIDQAKE